MTQPVKRPFKEKTIIVVQRFINSRSWKDAKKLVEENKNILLTNEAQAVLAEMIRKYSGSIWGGNEVWVIQEHRDLLLRCREEGIDTAFSERIPKK